MLDPKEVMNYADQLAYSIASQIQERNIDPVIGATAVAGVFKAISLQMGLSYDEFVDLCLTLALDYKEDLEVLEREE